MKGITLITFAAFKPSLCIDRDCQHGQITCTSKVADVPELESIFRFNFGVNIGKSDY